MNQKLVSKIIIASAVLAAPSVYAAETTFNGYASFVAGKAFKQGELSQIGAGATGSDKAVYLADPGYGGFQATADSNAVYSDRVSFKPDSNYGLQVKSDLNEGLSVTALIAGRGATDYAAEIEMMYLAYELAANTTMQVGRQRIPLFYYSDFFDVGYAYHWIRPPVDLYTNALINYDGVSLTQKASFGDWAFKGRIYGGSSENEKSRFGDLNTDALAGFNLDLSTDWLRLSASALHGDFYTKFDGSTTAKDNKQGVVFGSVSANLTLGGLFALAEYTIATSVEDEAYLDTQLGFRVTSTEANMFSVGYQWGSFTPHYTFSQSTTEVGDEGYALPGGTPFPGGEFNKRVSNTFGVRWDFHPSSAIKVEYMAAKDKSSDALIFLSGESLTANVVTVGFDVLF